MARNIFIWVGHPNDQSLSQHLADAYQSGATGAGAQTRRMNLSEMQFDPDLSHGYSKRKDHEPCLVEFLENTKWADHVAWFHPLWWGGMPAKMQGAIDRSFLPGIAFDYHEKDPWWDKLLEGRTGEVTVTADTPGLFLKWMYGNAHKHRITKQILGFTGVKVKRFSYFAPTKGATEKKIESWVKRSEENGQKAARS